MTYRAVSPYSSTLDESRRQAPKKGGCGAGDLRLQETVPMAVNSLDAFIVSDADVVRLDPDHRSQFLMDLINDLKPVASPADG